MVTLAIPWLVLDRLGSATLAGLVLAAASLPPLFIAPLSGWMVDHIGRARDRHRPRAAQRHP
jgi:MFS family permease